MNKKMMGIVLLFGVGVIAYMALKPATPVYTVPVTGNQSRDNKVTDILSIVTASVSSAAAIAKIIQSLQGMSDSQVQATYDNVKAGYNPYANYA